MTAPSLPRFFSGQCFSEKQLAAIGAFSIEWGRFDARINMRIGDLLQHSPASKDLVAITTHLNWLMKCDLLLSLMRNRLDDSVEPVKTQLRTLGVALRALGHDRNAIIHGLWYPENEETLVRRIVTARGQVELSGETITLTWIANVISAIYQMDAQITSFFGQHHLFATEWHDMHTWPDTDPEPS